MSLRDMGLAKKGVKNKNIYNEPTYRRIEPYM